MAVNNVIQVVIRLVDQITAPLRNVATQVRAVTAQVAASGAASRRATIFANLRQGARDAHQSLSRLRVGLRQTFIMFTGWRTIVGATIFAGLAKQAYGMSDALTNAASKIRIVTRSQQQLEIVNQKLYETAQLTRSEYESTVDLYTRVARSADQLGASQNQIIKFTELISKANIIAGSTAKEASAGMIQLGQALAAGALRGDELRSVLEQMPRVALAIAEGLGVTRGELRRMGEAGELTSQKIFQAILSQQDKLNSEFGKVTKTVEGASTQVRNALQKMVGETLQSTGATSKLVDSLDRLVAKLEDPETAAGFANFIGLVGDATGAVLGLAAAVGRLYEKLDQRLKADALRALPLVLEKAQEAQEKYGQTVSARSYAEAIVKDPALLLNDMFRKNITALRAASKAGPDAFQEELQRVYDEILADQASKLKRLQYTLRQGVIERDGELVLASREGAGGPPRRGSAARERRIREELEAAAAGGPKIRPEIKELLTTSQRIINDTGIAFKGLTETQREWLRSTQTTAQKAAESWYDFKATLEVLFDAGIIKAEEFNKRINDYLENNLEKAEVTARRIVVPMQELSEAGKRAIENIQDAFSEFFQGFEGGFKGLLRGILIAIRRTVAEAAAVRLTKILNIEALIRKAENPATEEAKKYAEKVFAKISDESQAVPGEYAKRGGPTIETKTPKDRAAEIVAQIKRDAGQTTEAVNGTTEAVTKSGGELKAIISENTRSASSIAQQQCACVCDCIMGLADVLRNVAPQLADEVKGIRVEVPAISEPQIEFPDIPAPVVNVPEFPDIPAPVVRVDVPPMPDIPAPVVNIPDFPEVPAPVVNVPDFPDIPAPVVNVPPMPDIEFKPVVRVDVPPIPDIPQPVVNIPDFPDIPAPVVNVPDFPEFPEVPQPVVNVPEFPKIPAPIVNVMVPNQEAPQIVVPPISVEIPPINIPETNLPDISIPEIEVEGGAVKVIDTSVREGVSRSVESSSGETRDALVDSAKTTGSAITRAMDGAAKTIGFDVRTAASGIISAIFRSTSNGSGFFEDLLGNLGSAFLGGAASGMFSMAGGGTVPSRMPVYRAGGGLVPVTVGEEGPETVLLPGGSKVINQRQAAYQSQPVTLNYMPSYNITIEGASDARETEQRMAGFLARRDARLKQDMMRMMQDNGLGRMR